MSQSGFATAAPASVLLHSVAARLPRPPSSRTRVTTSRASLLTAALIGRALFVKNLRCVAVAVVVVVVVVVS